MRKTPIFFLLLALSILNFSSSLSAQCCTHSLVINTGYNPLDGSVCAFGISDPKWKVTALSPDCAAVPGAVSVGSSAYDISPSAWPAAGAGSTYISFLNSYEYTGMPNDYYAMTMTRCFHLCVDADINININFSADDFISAMNIDGAGTPLSGPTIIPQPGTPASAGLTASVRNINQTVHLTAGTHCINISVGNNPASGAVGHGLDVTGNLTAFDPSGSGLAINAITAETEACLAYACTMPPIGGPNHLCPNTTIIATDDETRGTWSGGSSAVATIDPTTGTITGIAAGTTTITYTDCGHSATETITVNPAPSPFTPTAVTDGCDGDPLHLYNNTGCSSCTFAWAGPAIYSSTAANPVVPVASYDLTGWFTCSVTNSYGCTTAEPVHVSISMRPSATVGDPETICAGVTGVLHGYVGGTSYTWSGPGGFTSSGTTPDPSVFITPSVTTTYTLTAYQGSCSVTATQTVTVLPTPAAPLPEIVNLCAGTMTNTLTATLSPAYTGTGAVSYAWSPAATPCSTCGYDVIVPSVSGTYDYTVHAIATYTVSPYICTGTASVFTVNVTPTPGLPAVSGVMTICAGNTTTLTATASDATGYVWSPPATPCSTCDYDVVSPTVTTVYTVYAMDGACPGPSFSPTVTVIVPEITGPIVVCPGSDITLTGWPAGGTWSATPVSIGTISPLTAATADLRGIMSGTVTVFYTTTMCGTQTASLTVTVATPPAPSFVKLGGQPLAICQGSTVLVPAESGPGMWTAADYTWSASPTGIVSLSGASGTPVEGSVDVTGVSTGTVSLTFTVTDPVTGCSGSVSYLATVIPTPSVSVTYSAACGSAVLTASVATTIGFESYTWSPPTGLSATTGSTVTATPVLATVYTVMARNLNGCFSSATVAPPITHFSCACLASYTPLGTSGIISSPPAPGHYFINNNVTITASMPISDCIIDIAAGYSIKIKPGVAVTMSRCHLFSCGGMWTGIQLASSGTDEGRLYITGNTLIEDAQVAVDIPNPVTPPGYSTSGGPYIFVSSGAAFNKNTIAVRVTGYTPFIIPGDVTAVIPCYPFLIDNTIFTSRNFFSYSAGGTSWPLVWPAISGGVTALKTPIIPATPYDPPYNLSTGYTTSLCNNGLPAQTGIYLANVGNTAGTLSTAVYSGMVAGAIHSTGANNELNIYDYLIYGIYAQNSNVISRNSVFMHMHYSKGGGDGIYSGSTDNKHYKLWIYGTNYKNDDNQFYDCTNGVETSDLYNVRGDYSVMSSKHTSSAPSTVTGVYGYKMQSYNFYDVQINYNQLYNMTYGISLTTLPPPAGGTELGGQVTIKNNDLSAVSPAGAPPTLGEYVYLGITVNNLLTIGTYSTVVTGSQINVDENVLNGVYNGIYISNSNYSAQKITTDNNVINMSEDIIPAYATSPQAGIEHANLWSNYISGNTITGTGWNTPATPSSLSQNYNYPMPIPLMEGIHVATTKKSYVQCNHTSNINTGEFFGGTNNIDLFAENEMQSSAYGYILDGYIGPQLTAAPTFYTTGNSWTTTPGFVWSGTNYQTYTMGSSSPSASAMNVSTVTPSNDPSRNYSDAPPLPIFIYGGALGSGTGNGLHRDNKPNIACTPAPSGTITARVGYVQAARKRLPYIYENEKKNWIGQMGTWKSIKADTSLMDSLDVLQSFWLMSNSSRYKYLNEIEKKISNGHYAAARTMLACPIDSLANTDSDAVTGAVMADGAAANEVVRHYKRYYHLLIKYRRDTLTEADSAEISTLAHLCPYTDGDVVYQARVLYGLINNGIVILSDIDCEGRGKQPDTEERPATDDSGVVQSDEAGQAYTLYPNPNKGMMTLRQNLPDDAQVQAELYNAAGMSVDKRQIYFTAGVAKLSLAGLPAGLYLLNLTDSKGTHFMLKFVINE